MHDEVKDKEFELEMSWICDESGRVHKPVPKELQANFDEFTNILLVLRIELLRTGDVARSRPVSKSSCRLDRCVYRPAGAWDHPPVFVLATRSAAWLMAATTMRLCTCRRRRRLRRRRHSKRWTRIKVLVAFIPKPGAEVPCRDKHQISKIRVIGINLLFLGD